MIRQYQALLGAQGFTLLEALVALAVVTMTLSVSIPIVRAPAAPAILRAEALNLALGLRSTRALAMSSGHASALQIEIDRSTYSSPVFQMRRVDPRISLKVTAAKQLGEAAVASILFFPSGRSSGGTVAMQMDSFNVQISIDWITGHVGVK